MVAEGRGHWGQVQVPCPTQKGEILIADLSDAEGHRQRSAYPSLTTLTSIHDELMALLEWPAHQTMLLSSWYQQIGNLG